LRVERPDEDVRAHRGERQLRDQGDADPGRDQALDGLVVVAFEGDAGVETGLVAGADDVPGAGAGGRGLYPRILRQVLEPQAAAAGEAVIVGEGEVERIVEQIEAAHAGTEPLAEAGELEEEDEVELARPQPRCDLLRLPLGEGQLDAGVGGAKGSHRTRHQGGAGSREGGDPEMATVAGGDRGDLAFGRLDLGEDAACVPSEGGAGSGRPGA
jgi:hypothetical protein